MNTNKAIFLSQHFLAMRVADIFHPEIKQRLMFTKNNKVLLPAPFTIYDKEIVIEQFKKIIEETGDGNPSNNSPSSISGKSNGSFYNSKIYSRNLLYKAREKSRFNFVNNNFNYNSKNFNSNSSSNSLSFSNLYSNFTKNNFDENFEVPSFVSYLISKKCSRYSFFKNFSTPSNSADDFIYFDKNLIREYNDNNPWARFIVSTVNNQTLKIGIEKLAQKEQLKILKKFNSA